MSGALSWLRVKNPGGMVTATPLWCHIKSSIRAKPTGFWLEKMRSIGIPGGQVRSVGDALRSPEAAGRNMVSDIPHPTAGRVSLVASPLKLARTPVIEPVAPPLLGEHTESVLRQVLNY